MKEGEAAEPPCPFGSATSKTFIEWLNEPIRAALGDISRYNYSIYEDRSDLRAAFPDLAGQDGPRYVEWLRLFGSAEEAIPVALQPPAIGGETGRPGAGSQDTPSRGINIAGYFEAEMGVGEAARLLTCAVEAAGVPYSTVSYAETLSRKQYPFLARGDGKTSHDINILCVNADQTPVFAREIGPRFFKDRYTVGYWFWELDQLSCDHARGFRPCGRSLDREPVRRARDRRHRSPARLQDSAARTRSGLFSARHQEQPAAARPVHVSVHVRFLQCVRTQESSGLIEAFERAFRPNEGPILVRKTINGTSRLNDLERVRAAARRRPDVFVIDGYYSERGKNSILNLSDCYVSLHRSEGLGLTIAEAMALEKPVIATGYSGNLEFMTPENSYLVDYVVGEVPAECHPYPPGMSWAEPDLDQAAALMRRVVDAPLEAARKAARGRHDILTKHDVNSSALRLTERINQIRQSRQPAELPAAHSQRPVAEAPSPAADPLPGLGTSPSC